MKAFWKKSVAVSCCCLILNLGTSTSVQAFWDTGFWSQLSANIFSINADEDLPDGLFFDWEDRFSDNTFVMAFQNSDDLRAQVITAKDNLADTVESLGETELGMFAVIFGSAYVGMLETAIEGLDLIDSVELGVQYDVEKMAQISDIYSASVELGLDPTNVAAFEELGLCLSLNLNADAEIISQVSEALKGSWDEGNIDFSVTKTEESIALSAGCQDPLPSILTDLPETVNLAVMQKAFDYEALYSGSETTEVSPSLDSKILDFYSTIRDLNTQRVMEDLNAGAYLMTLKPGGYKTQIVAALKTEETTKLLQNYWAGVSLKTPFFMNQNADYTPQILSFSGSDSQYLFFEEDFTGLDWTHWYGKFQEFSMNIMPMIAMTSVVGLGSLSGIAMTDGPDESLNAFSLPNDITDPIEASEMAAALMLAHMAASPEFEPPTTADEIRTILFEQGNLLLPLVEDQCFYYLRSQSQPSEFAIFANTQTVEAFGSEKMSAAANKIFASQALTCETPEIKGAVLLNLSK